MIQLNNLDKRLTEVLNDESGLVVGGDNFGLGYSGNINYSSNLLNSASNSISSATQLPSNPRSGPDPQAPYKSPWAAPIGAGPGGATIVGIQGGDGKGNVYGVSQGGSLSWQNQSGTGATVAPGILAGSVGFKF